MFFNGRYIIPCAVIAGGTKGGVTRDNFNEVLIEVERYLDSDEYNADGDGVRTISNKDWKPKEPLYTFTDWHDSRRCVLHHTLIIVSYTHTLPLHRHTYVYITYDCVHRYSPNLVAAKKRGHHILCFIPNTTFKTQPNDVQGFDKAKAEVADIKVARNLIGDQDRYITANVWVNAILSKW